MLASLVYKLALREKITGDLSKAPVTADFANGDLPHLVEWEKNDVGICFALKKKG